MTNIKETLHLEETRCWLALSRALGFNARHVRELFEHFDDVDRVFAAPPAALKQLGLPSAAITLITRSDWPDWERVDRDLAWLQAADNRHLITWSNPVYPPLLREIATPPLLLFVEGDPACLSAPQLAIVGSRNPTPIALETAQEFACHLSKAGLVVTSGLALGIDAAGHTGALAGAGVTIAVMGTGPEQIYPRRHQALAHRIVAQGGALVTEYPTGITPKPECFPLRNRIVAGLSLGTLVVEATLRSGSLITARLATEQGREVFAIPGSIHNPLARGCHVLLRQGAKLVETADDILEELGPLSIAAQTSARPQANYKESHEKLDADYLKLLEYIDYAATPMDVLVARSGLAIAPLSSMLLLLELQGYVSAVPGGYMRKQNR